MGLHCMSLTLTCEANPGNVGYLVINVIKAGFPSPKLQIGTDCKTGALLFTAGSSSWPWEHLLGLGKGSIILEDIPGARGVLHPISKESHHQTSAAASRMFSAKGHRATIEH